MFFFLAKSTPNLFTLTNSPDDTESEDSSKPNNKVEVPQVNDETISDFFQTKPLSDLSTKDINMTDDDIVHLFLESQDM